MTSNKRRKFSAEYKAEVVLEVLTGKASVAEVARKRRIKDTLIYGWRAEAVDRLPEIFSTRSPDDEGQARIGELERLIGQLTVENDALKKASRWLSRVSRANDRS
jgi:transposase-like protein